ncbi:MAG: sensor histidine kinase [Gemmatimonadales bacterium]
MTAQHRRAAARAYASAAGVYVALALLRTAFRVTAIPRPPAAAALALAQALLLAVPWVLLTPPVVVLVGRIPWIQGRRARAVAAHLGLALLLSLVDGAWSWTATGWLGQPRPASALMWYLGRVDQALFLYAFLAATSVARRRLRDLDAIILRAARLETRLLDARLHVLSLQLHPHFLFNTLNAVSELVHRDAGAAAGLARRLRRLLDRSLADDTAQEVPLREELALLEAYADIQRLRFQGSLTVTIAVDPDAMDAAVPRLVLQPLVENAIRHGTSRRAAPGQVTVRGRCVGDRLVLEVEDDGRGLPPGAVREGVGLGNTRARLRELHGTGARLELCATTTGTLAWIELPLGRAVVPPATASDGGAPDPSGEALVTAPRPIRWGAMAAAISAAWIAAALVGTHEDVVAGWITRDPTPFPVLFRPRLGEALLWIPLTALVLRWAGGLARRGVSSARLVGAHVAGALVVLGLHLLAVKLWVTPVMDGTYAAGCLIYDLCAYVALAGGAHAWTVGRLVAEGALEAARLERDLATTHLATLRWRLDPAFVGDTLETIAALAAAEPGRADELTGRLGEELRVMLAGAPA